MPYRTGYVFKGRAHEHITRLRNGVISGHIIVISEYLGTVLLVLGFLSWLLWVLFVGRVCLGAI